MPDEPSSGTKTVNVSVGSILVWVIRVKSIESPEELYVFSIVRPFDSISL